MGKDASRESLTQVGGQTELKTGNKTFKEDKWDSDAEQQ